VSSRKKAAAARPVPVVAPGPNDAYDIAYFRRHKDDDPTETVPGQVFLAGVPTAVAARCARS